jgi:hypothetical protein
MDNIAELASLYLLFANYLTGLLMSVTSDVSVSLWFALLLAANAAFLLAMLGLAVRSHAPKLVAVCRCCGRGRGLGLQQAESLLGRHDEPFE